MDQPDRSLSEALVSLLARDIGPQDRERAALHLLDWLGCALVGRHEPVGRAIARISGSDPIALAEAGDPAARAGALGGLGSLLEMDDVHKAALLHPGPVVAAVVLAVPGPDPLAAMIRGYEAMIRLGRSVGPAHYAQFHNTGTCGGMGAAVAAAGLMGLSRGATVDAVGHAVSLSAGLWQCRNEPVQTKHLHVAEAARRGVSAARYAAEGLPGPRHILEGPQGFFAGLAPNGTPDLVLSGDSHWLIHEVSFKPWPACRHVHAAIDAALALRDDLASPPRSIRVASYRDALLFCDAPKPTTAAEARFSLQHAVAVALRDGAPAPGAFAPASLNRYADLRARVEVSEDAALSAAYPARFGADLRIETEDGRTHAARITDAWGDPENPMPPDAVRAKFARLCTAAGLDRPVAVELDRAVLSLPASGDLSPVRDILRQIATRRA